jgi:hypothetical protein
MSKWVKFILVNFPKWEAGEPTLPARMNLWPDKGPASLTQSKPI